MLLTVFGEFTYKTHLVSWFLPTCLNLGMFAPTFGTHCLAVVACVNL